MTIHFTIGFTGRPYRIISNQFSSPYRIFLATERTVIGFRQQPCEFVIFDDSNDISQICDFFTINLQ